MRSQFTVVHQLRIWLRYFYQVPWCVPPWGWREFLRSLGCILKGRIVNGPDISNATDAVRSFLGIRYVLPLNRGRTAIELAVRAMGIGEGDDVVLPSYICSSVLDAVLRLGANPVFADVGSDLNVTRESIKAAVTPKTKCVIVAHLFGKAAPIDEIDMMLRSRGVALIDDAAQAFGARRSARLVGTFGACGIISCGPGKQLVGAAGGFLVTDNEELYKRAAAIPLERESATLIARRLLSFWIWRRFRRFSLPFRMLLDRLLGREKEPPHINSTMSNLDAAIAVEQIRRAGKNSLDCRRAAHILLGALGRMAQASVSDLSEDSVPTKLVLVCAESELSTSELKESLASVGIETQGGYFPLHLSEFVKHPELSITETMWVRVLCIPLGTRLKKTNQLAALCENWNVSQEVTGTITSGINPRFRGQGPGGETRNFSSAAF